MKINKFIVVACLLVGAITQHSFAQSKVEDILTSLDKQLIEVEMGKNKTDPSVSFDKKTPCSVVFTIVNTDTKGKSETFTYELGLSDISPQQLRAITKGNVRAIEVVAKDRQDFIKFSKEGEFKSYVEKFDLPTFDNDAAKSIIETLKSVIDICEKSSESCAKPASFMEANSQIQTLIGKININDIQIEQTLQFDKKILTRATLTTQESGKSKSIEHTYTFDFADFADNKVKFSIVGKLLKVQIFSRNGEMVQRTENGKCQNNANQIDFLAADIAQAKCFVKTLSNLISFAREEAEKRLPPLTDLEAALNLVVDNVQSFEQCTTNREQSLDKKVLTTYSLANNTEGGKKNDKLSFNFNFLDINPKSLETKVTGNAMGVRLRTNDSKNYIRVLKNDDLQSYDNELVILTKSGEEAKLLIHALKKVIELCPKTSAADCDKKSTAAIDCAITRIKTVKQGDIEVKQTLEKVLDNEFKARLKIELFKGKSTEEVDYEWNMKDIDTRRTELKVNGKEVSVVLLTKNNEKIVKLNKKDKTEYTNRISVDVESIEEGRALTQIFHKISE